MIFIVVQLALYFMCSYPGKGNPHRRRGCETRRVAKCEVTGGWLAGWLAGSCISIHVKGIFGTRVIPYTLYPMKRIFFKAVTKVCMFQSAASPESG